MVDPLRAINLNDISKTKGPVVYWMSRDMRVTDNWALLFAIEKANDLNVALRVAFTLAPTFEGAVLRHYHFLLEGLKEVEQSLAIYGIGFHLLLGDPAKSIVQFTQELKAGYLVSDFDPLRIKQLWKSTANQELKISHYLVDAHNIVPCWIASQKQEFGAYTFRPKIRKLLPKYLNVFPPIPNVGVKSNSDVTDWESVIKWLNPNSHVLPVDWIRPGVTAASEALNDFLHNRLSGYSVNRNNPVSDGQSNLSPYLHFGHLSAQRVASEVLRFAAPEEDKSAFLEELIVRRELSDNFCMYNPNYDNLNGIHSWAKETVNKHFNDEREYNYTIDEFEDSKTHDNLWNAAQLQMLKTGKMHGYMRMYWAKKILEWSANPAQALKIALFLNDKYSLDGRDPNGYAGIAWSIGGVHDRAWSERPVFGKIRYMNYNGCKRKFNVEGYIEMVRKL